MEHFVSAVSGKAKMVAELYGIKVPAEGFDSGSWEATLDAFFPVLEGSILLVDFLIETAPEGHPEELMTMLKGYTAAMSCEIREVSFA